MFPKFSQNMRNKKTYLGLYVPYIDSKSSLFPYHDDKTRGISDTRHDLFFVLIIPLLFYLPLHYQAGFLDSGFITNEPHQLPHDTLHTGSIWLLLTNWSVLWNTSLSWSSGTCQVSSLTVISSFGSPITQPAGVMLNPPTKNIFLEIQIYWLLAVKSKAIALSVRLGVSNLLSIGGLTVPRISAHLTVCKKDQRNIQSPFWLHLNVANLRLFFSFLWFSPDVRITLYPYSHQSISLCIEQISVYKEVWLLNYTGT